MPPQPTFNRRNLKASWGVVNRPSLRPWQMAWWRQLSALRGGRRWEGKHQSDRNAPAVAQLDHHRFSSIEAWSEGGWSS